MIPCKIREINLLPPNQDSEHHALPAHHTSNCWMTNSFGYFPEKFLNVKVVQLTLMTGDPPRPPPRWWCCLLIEVKLDLCIFVTSKYWGCHWGHWRLEVFQTSSVNSHTLFFDSRWFVTTSRNLLFQFYVIPQQ